MKKEILDLIGKIYEFKKNINPDDDIVMIEFIKDDFCLCFYDFEKKHPTLMIDSKNWQDVVYAKFKKDNFASSDNDLYLHDFKVDSWYSLVFVPNTIILKISEAVEKITKEEVLVRLENAEKRYQDKLIEETNSFFDLALGTDDVEKKRGKNEC